MPIGEYLTALMVVGENGERTIFGSDKDKLGAIQHLIDYGYFLACDLNEKSQVVLCSDVERILKGESA